MSAEFQMAAFYGSSVGLSLISIALGRSSMGQGFLSWKRVATSLVRFVCVQIALLATAIHSVPEAFAETLPAALWSATACNLMLLLTTLFRISDAYLSTEIFDGLNMKTFLIRSALPTTVSFATWMTILAGMST